MTLFPRALNLRRRLTLLLLVASLPGMGVAVALAVNALTVQTEQIETSAARLAALHAAQHTAVIEGARLMLAAMIGGEAFAEVERAECGNFLRGWIDEYPSFTSLALIDAAGGVVCSSAGSELPFDPADRPWFKQVRADKAFTVGQYTIGRTGVPLIVAAQPILEPDGDFDGALAVGIDLRWLEFLARTAELPPNGTVTALDANGGVLVHHTAPPSPERSEPSREPPPSEELRRQMAVLDSGVVRGLNAASEPRVYGFHRTDSGGLVVAVGMPPYVFFARYGAALRDTLTAPLAILLLALGAAWWGAEALITRWVRSLTRTARRMAEGDLSARSDVPHSTTYEIGKLAAAFDRMAGVIERDQGRLRAALDQRETLLRELNHRIKNAFALVHSLAVQTLRHSPSLGEFEQAFLGRIDALARISTLLAADGGEAVDLRALVEATLAPHRTDGNLRLRGPEVAVAAPTARTLSLALHELATNAAKYGALSVPQGRVEVAWRVDAAVPSEGERRLVLDWTELDGPKVQGAPERRGFGSALIERSIAYELDGATRLEFPPEGVRCRIELPLTRTDPAIRHPGADPSRGTPSPSAGGR